MNTHFNPLSMTSEPTAPVVEKLERLLSILRPHTTAEEFAGHVVREVGPEANEIIHLLFHSLIAELKVIQLIVAIESKEQSLTNPKKED